MNRFSAELSARPALDPDAEGWLVLSRHVGEDLVIEAGGHLIELRINEVRGGKVRVGFRGPRAARFHRREIWERIHSGPAGEVATEQEAPCHVPLKSI